MEIDYEFVQQMLTKHYKHLMGVEKNIETLLAGYDRQLDSLAKLDQSKYGWRVKELEAKKAEALEKLSFIVPNMEKINQQNEVIAKILFLRDHSGCNKGVENDCSDYRHESAMPFFACAI